MKRALQGIGVIAFGLWAVWFFIPFRTNWAARTDWIVSNLELMYLGWWDIPVVGSLLLLGVSGISLFLSSRVN